MSDLGALAAAIAAASLVFAASPDLPRSPLTHPDAQALRWLLPSWSLRRWELARAGLVACVAALAITAGMWPLAAIAAAVPSLGLRWHLARRRAAAGARSAELLRATSAAMRSGVTLPRALRLAVGNADDLARDPFERAIAAFELHDTLESALREAGREAFDRRVAFALRSLALVAGEQLPSARGAAVVAGAADRLAFEHRLAEEVRARTSGARAQIVLLALLVPALAGYLVVSMPGLAATLGTPLGLYVLIPAAGILEIAGIVASRAIARSIA